MIKVLIVSVVVMVVASVLVLVVVSIWRLRCWYGLVRNDVSRGDGTGGGGGAGGGEYNVYGV